LQFAAFLEECNDIVSYVKNYMAVHFQIDYVNADGNISNYYPDFIVKQSSNSVVIVETKGLEDLDVPLKMKRLCEWCVDINNAQSDIKYDYVFVDEESFNKYKPKTDINCLNVVFSSIAANVGQQIKYTGLAKDFTIPTIKKAFNSLLLARVAKKVRAVSSPGNLLKANASDKKFKCLFLDIGLMNRMMGLDYNEALNHKNLLAIYRGQLAEQFVGQEFAIINKNQLFYWARDAKNSNAEIDFLFASNKKFIPIEVKDGPSGKLRSLHLFRKNYDPPYSVVFHSGQMGILKVEKIIFLPLYFVGAFTQFGISFPESSE